MRDKLLRWIVYFKRGHSAWFVFIISLLNFTVIQYKLLIENVGFLKSLLPSMSLFLITFLASYIPLATLVGWIDAKRATLAKEYEIHPYYLKLAPKERILWRSLIKLAESIETVAWATSPSCGREVQNLLKPVKQELEKWLKKS